MKRSPRDHGVEPAALAGDLAGLDDAAGRGPPVAGEDPGGAFVPHRPARTAQDADGSTLACAVGADQHIVLAEMEVGPVNSAEAAYRESEQLHRESVSAERSVVFQNLEQLCDHLELSFVRAGQHDRLEVRVDRL